MSTCYLQSCKRCPFTPSFVSFCTAKGYVLQSERARFANQVNTRQGVEDVQLCLTRVKRSVTCGATDTHRRASKRSNINLPFALFEDDVNCRLLPQVPFATLTPPAVKHHSTSSRPFGTLRQKRILLIFRYLYAPPWRTDIINYVLQGRSTVRIAPASILLPTGRSCSPDLQIRMNGGLGFTPSPRFLVLRALCLYLFLGL